MTPVSTDTPKSARKPMPDDTLRCVPVVSRATNPPIGAIANMCRSQGRSGLEREGKARATMAEVRNDALTLPHTGMRFRRLKDSAEIRVRREIVRVAGVCGVRTLGTSRSEEHTSELQSLAYLVCRLLLEKKNK